jgi:hypothetical protein
VKARSHDVTLVEATSFIKQAIFSLERRHWTEESFINFYSQSGGAYVRKRDNVIRTAFKKDEFNWKIKSIMERLK